MRTSSRAVSVAWVALAIFAMTPIYAFDGTKDTAQDAAAVAVIPAPGGGVMEKPVPPADIPQQTALSTLQYAADDGHPAAQWKLGRMYADGIVVPRDDLRAFDYFSRIANQHAEDSPAAPQASIVANAFVALGRYYSPVSPAVASKPIPSVRGRCSPTPRPISAMPTRNTILRKCI